MKAVVMCLLLITFFTGCVETSFNVKPKNIDSSDVIFSDVEELSLFKFTNLNDFNFYDLKKMSLEDSDSSVVRLEYFVLDSVGVLTFDDALKVANSDDLISRLKILLTVTSYSVLGNNAISNSRKGKDTDSDLLILSRYIETFCYGEFKLNGEITDVLHNLISSLNEISKIIGLSVGLKNITFEQSVKIYQEMNENSSSKYIKGLIHSELLKSNLIIEKG
jgi:hypothetical protein